MLSAEIVLEKKPLKILHNSQSLEIVLPFSIRSIFSPFKGLFVKKCIIVFQKVLLSVTFLYPHYCSLRWHEHTFFNWCIFIEYIKNSSFKSSQISVIKVASEYFRSKLIVVKDFVITVFDSFRLSFMETCFKFCYSKKMKV